MKRWDNVRPTKQNIGEQADYPAASLPSNSRNLSFGFLFVMGN
jgi:hypothetical protein